MVPSTKCISIMIGFLALVLGSEPSYSKSESQSGKIHLKLSFSEWFGNNVCESSTTSHMGVGWNSFPTPDKGDLALATELVLKDQFSSGFRSDADIKLLLSDAKGLGSRLKGLALESPVSNIGAKQLTELKGLEYLYIVAGKNNGSSVSDLIRHFGTSLKSLRFEGHLSSLEGRFELSHLEAFATKSLKTDDEFKLLNGMKKLKCVFLGAYNMSGDSLNGSGLKHIPSPQHIRAIRLEGSSFTDASLEAMEKMSNLVSVEIDGGRITDGGLKHLSKLQKIESISLKHMQHMSGAGLSELSKVKALKKVDLICRKGVAENLPSGLPFALTTSCEEDQEG